MKPRIKKISNQYKKPQSSYPILSYNNEEIRGPDFTPYIQIKPLSATNRESKYTKTNPKDKNYNNYFSLSYLPKRKVKDSSENFLEESAKVKEPLVHIMPTIPPKDPIDPKIEQLFSETDLIAFRTDYLIKFSKNAENLKKLKGNVEILSDNKRNICDGYTTKINKIYSSFNQFIFKENFQLEYYRTVLSNYYEYTTNIIKLFNELYSEIKSLKDKNLMLEKFSRQKDAELSSKENEIDEINHYISKYELTSKAKSNKNAINSIKGIEKDFIRKENAYVITIYRLEEEIKSLTSLLGEKKVSTENFKEKEAELEEKKKEIDELRVGYNKEINDLTVRIAVYRDKVEDMTEQIDSLTKKNESLNEKNEEVNRLLVEYRAQKKNLREIIEEKEKIIASQNEELERLKEKEKNKIGILEESKAIDL